MQSINLQNTPNQEFTVTLDGVIFDITLRAVNDAMYADIMANNVQLVSGSRCVSGYQIIPYVYQEGVTGNFSFLTNNFELPWWEEFGISQTLYYLNASDILLVRSNVPI